ncbi:MAG: hypothetical protein PF572_06775 [Patescibacteria group bacterium]|jgi:hypothetical protein|nr:hypothetical protein [Patescibacteria group bacterium]
MEIILKKLYSSARNRFCKTASSFALDEKDINDIERLLMFTDIQISEKAFLDSVKKIFAKGALKVYDDLNPYVRDFQVFSSYYVNIMPNGEPVSRFLYGVDLSKHECRMKQPTDYKAFVELLYSAHIEIDKYLVNIEEESNKRIIEIEKILKKQGITDEMEKDARDQNVDSIAHYILNWYFRLVPFNVYKNSAKKLAAISLYVLKRFNEGMTNLAICNYTNKDLSELGKWKSSNGVAGSGTTAFYDVMYSIPDPQLLFIRHASIPPDWQKKMKKIIPNWENQLENDMKS